MVNPSPTTLAAYSVLLRGGTSRLYAADGQAALPPDIEACLERSLVASTLRGTTSGSSLSSASSAGDGPAVSPWDGDF